MISPERTSSGYRKFYDDDVELLRVILTEQRRNYLPLRVIKDRLDSGEIDPTGEHLRPNGEAIEDDEEVADQPPAAADDPAAPRTRAAIRGDSEGEHPRPPGVAAQGRASRRRRRTRPSAAAIRRARSDAGIDDCSRG